MSHEAIARTFDQWAREGRDEGMETEHQNVVEQVVERTSFRAGEKILDLGCGNGWATRLLAKTVPGATAVGIDASPEMIARAEELHSYTIRARYEVGRFEELDLPEGEFDRVFSMEALYYAVDLERALAEVFRVLKSGGRADIVIDYYEESPGTAGWPEYMGVEMNRKSEAAWRGVFEASGFTEVSTERVHDSRAPTEADPEAGKCNSREVAEAGSLWIRARKPT